MGRWRNYVVSKMQWQIRGRRQSPLSRHDTEEEDLSEMQVQLSDIGSIAAAKAERAASTEVGETKEKKIKTKEKTNDV